MTHAAASLRILSPMSSTTHFAQSVIRDEAAALVSMADALAASDNFARATKLIVDCANAGGTVLVTGLGKSGHIGAKISATMASLGITSHSVHPTEAAHGDLGRFRSSDTVIAISFSGETDEVVGLCGILRQDGLPIISITGGAKSAAEPSSLERLATVALRLGVAKEAGAPQFVAPTTSTTATLAMGDALALAAARERNFTSTDFARRHPGGSLGGLLRPVTEVMRWTAGKNLPLIDCTMSVEAALKLADQGRRPGAMVLVNPATGMLAGIFTDGDLRRLVLRNPASLREPIDRVMTKSPRTLRDDSLVQDAVAMFREFRQDEIPVVDAAGKPAGILDVQDLIAMKLVTD